MYKQKQFLFFVLFLFSQTLRTFSQISVSPSNSGCPPFSVILSGPAGAVNPYWTLGAGQGTSLLQSPSVLYINPGTYNITYTATVAGSPVSYNTVINVLPPPSGNYSFTQPTTHCAPMPVSFSGTGAGPGGTYTWVFGDLGALGSGASPTHTYTSANNFVPVLVLTSANGCTAVATAPTNSIIHVSSPPVILITSSNGYNGCIPPFVTNISGANSISGSPITGGVLTFNWTFTGGSPAGSGAAIPGSVSFGNGSSSISVLVTDNNNCSNVQTIPVTVANPSLTATIPQTVCLNMPIPATVQTSQSSASFLLSGSLSPTYFFTTPGTPKLIDTIGIFTSCGPKTITVAVQSSANCPIVNVVKQVFVECVSPSFTCTPPGSTCGPSMAVTYINTSSVNNGSTLTFTWVAGWLPNASHSAVPSTTTTTNMGPVTLTLTQGSLNPYTIYQYFMPNITLIAQSNSIAHCWTSTIIGIYDTVIRPSAWFYTDKQEGCAPLTVTFKDSSFFSHTFPLTSYTWCNGATPPVFVSGSVPLPPSTNSVIPNQVFTYNTAGTYTPYLIIQTTGGCADTSYKGIITVVNTPTVSATYPSIVCAGQPVSVVMHATTTAVPSSSTISNWHFESDAGYFSGCVTDSVPIFAFTHVGVHNVTVSAVQAGCRVSQVLPQTITVKGPFGRFRFETNCDVNRKSVVYYVHLQAATSATVYFGDGSGPTSYSIITGNATANTSSVITHVYANTGNYNVSMVSINPGTGCPNSLFNQTVKIRNPVARITFNGQPLPSLPIALACTKSEFKFSGSTSSDAYLSCSRGYSWFFKTPTYTLYPIDHIYPNFAVHPGNGPAPPVPPVIPFPSDPVSRDTFRVAGTYTLTLRIKDENNCIDDTTVIFRISSAKPAFNISPNPVCLSAGTVQLINTTEANQVAPDAITSYSLIYGDGSAPQILAPPFLSQIHNLTTAFPPFTVFSASMVAVNSLGCRDTTIKSWQVNNPFPYFNSTDPYPCIATNSFNTVNFSATPGYATYSVSYGDPPGPPTWATSSNFAGASHTYYAPGIYVSTLTVIDNAGCRATQSRTIHAIGQPTAGLFFPPNGNKQFCREDAVTIESNSSFNIDPINSFVWGVATPLNTLTIPSSTITNIKPFLPRGVSTISLSVFVIVDGSPHCESKAVIQPTVFTTSAMVAVTPTIFCLGESISASINILSDVGGWKWFFGDNVPQPAHALGSPTTEVYPYTIYPSITSTGATTLNLLYTSPGGACTLIASQPLQVIKVDADFKQIRDNYAHCMGIADTFINTTKNPLDLKYKFNWSFGDGSISATGSISSTTYKAPGVYTVSFTTQDEQYSCIGTAIKQVTVYASPKASLVITQTLSCPNASFAISGSGNAGLSGPVSGTLTPLFGSPAITMSANNDFTTAASASVTTTFTLKVTDTNGCESEPATDIMNIVAPAPSVNWDTLVVIGEHTPLNAYLSPGFTYTWSPLIVDLNCTECFIPNPISSTTVNVTYTVLVEDELKCSIVKSFYTVMINPKVTLDVPTAFTPNGDGTNDIIYPAGWGLKKLLYFRIYNRWGQLLFDSNDLKQGWDGVFNGVPQNMETYVYQVSAETYLPDQPVLSKSGTFKLLR